MRTYDLVFNRDRRRGLTKDYEARKSCRALPGWTGEGACPHVVAKSTTALVSRRTGRWFRFRDENLECGTSRWGRGDCHREVRSPTSRLESSRRPESR